MVAITTLDDGHVLHFNDDAVAGLAGPRPHDVGPHTYVFGATPAPVVTAESVASLMARLDPHPPFAQLTRPNGTPVWIRGSSVTGIRDPLGVERQSPPAVARSVVTFAGNNQAVQEDFDHAKPILLAAGTKASILA